MNRIDSLIITFDKALRTLFAPAQAARPSPAERISEAPLTPAEKRLSAALVRVDHAGEVCAQALYQGQAFTAREARAKNALREAAREETEHLAWTEQRIAELGGRPSLLNPFWYAGSLALGALAGLMGEKWNLGFLAETERQVVLHLDGHLKRLPAGDEKSRVLLRQMKRDEGRHATVALYYGGADLPLPVRLAMRLSSKLMTETSYWI
jgi:ubiquinone biosynthesis monooxygenase Coq7